MKRKKAKRKEYHGRARFRKNFENLSFKEASTELERIVRSLETGVLELEQSLEAYKKGVALVALLKTRLETAEHEVSVLAKEIPGATDAE